MDLDGPRWMVLEVQQETQGDDRKPTAAAALLRHPTASPSSRDREGLCVLLLSVPLHALFFLQDVVQLFLLRLT